MLFSQFTEKMEKELVDDGNHQDENNNNDDTLETELKNFALMCCAEGRGSVTNFKKEDRAFRNKHASHVDLESGFEMKKVIGLIPIKTGEDFEALYTQVQDRDLLVSFGLLLLISKEYLYSRKSVYYTSF